MSKRCIVAHSDYVAKVIIPTQNRFVKCWRGTNSFQDNICHKTSGLVRDLNPGPRAPEARIIPLDQRAGTRLVSLRITIISSRVSHFKMTFLLWVRFPSLRENKSVFVALMCKLPLLVSKCIFCSLVLRLSNIAVHKMVLGKMSFSPGPWFHHMARWSRGMILA